jgi:hypothetical protein
MRKLAQSSGKSHLNQFPLVLSLEKHNCEEKIMLKMLRPDSKGRITLGPLAEGISGFSVTVTNDHKIILEPYSEIPAREKWLFENKQALKMVNQGLKDAADGRLKSKGSFSKFTKEDK